MPDRRSSGALVTKSPGFSRSTVEDARDAEACIGVRARSEAVAAWAGKAPSSRPIRESCPDRDVDGAYRALRATVARGLAYRTGSSDLAEDLTQDVFVDLLLAARCRPPSNTRAWLARVAQRHAADTIGSAVRERSVRARLEATSRADADAPASDPDIRLAIRESMAALSPSQQTIIALRLLEGLPFARCGLILGMNEDAARMRFRRALHALRRDLTRTGLEGR
jgi:RNA polymerase sigma factor (sigma-70 family)